MPKDYVTKKYFNEALQAVLKEKDYVTKKYFKDSLEATLEKYVTKDHFNATLFSFKEEIKQEIRNVGAIVEDTNHRLQAIAEIAVSHAVTLTNHEERISKNTEMVKNHEIFLETQ